MRLPVMSPDLRCLVEAPLVCEWCQTQWPGNQHAGQPAQPAKLTCIHSAVCRGMARTRRWATCTRAQGAQQTLACLVAVSHLQTLSRSWRTQMTSSRALSATCRTPLGRHASSTSASAAQVIGRQRGLHSAARSDAEPTPGLTWQERRCLRPLLMTCCLCLDFLAAAAGAPLPQTMPRCSVACVSSS